MAVKFFGQYLVELNIISREALLKAIELQESVNRSTGETAVGMGLMTNAAVDQVNRAQRSEDLRFGDLAVKMGFLTPDALQQVLQQQSASHLYIGAALVRVGAIAEKDLDRYLEEFKADQSPYATASVMLPQGVKHRELLELMADLGYKMLTRVARLNFRPAPCEIVTVLQKSDLVVSMDITGDVRCRYILAVSKEVQNQIARTMLSQQDVAHEPAEVLDDAVMEFVNVVCGNIVAKSVGLGIALDILPPELLDSTDGIEIPPEFTALNFPVCLTDGEASISIILYP